MATTERPRAAVGRRKAVYAVGTVVTIVVVVAVIAGLRRPPQMGADEGVFRTVDALFTAVTARDERQLGECDQRLRGYREAGKLPEGAADYLDGVIGQARDGDWEAAAKRLYEFMSAQRREGVREHPPTRAKSAAAPRGGGVSR